MENSELLKRAEDLRARCERSGSITHSGYLSPAERYAIECWAKHRADCSLVFHGGGADCDRTVAFFLPYYMEWEDFLPEEYICAIKLTAHFATPGHRDYMGAVLGMGVGREWVGDIAVSENTAYIYCLPTVQRHLLSIDKVGRAGVSAEALELSQVPQQERRVQEITFSVMSARLDAIVGGMFKLSRTESAKQIVAGNVSLNYTETFKTDAPVREGDIISLRGAGKGKITGTGGTSRKGRTFIYAETYK